MKTEKPRITRKEVPIYEMHGVLANTPVLLDEDEATTLYEELASTLGKPMVERIRCTDRMSHPPHAEISKKTGAIKYCEGRGQDAT